MGNLIVVYKNWELSHRPLCLLLQKPPESNRAAIYISIYSVGRLICNLTVSMWVPHILNVVYWENIQYLSSCLVHILISCVITLKIFYRTFTHTHNCVHFLLSQTFYHRGPALAKAESGLLYTFPLIWLLIFLSLAYWGNSFLETTFWCAEKASVFQWPWELCLQEF